MHLLLGLLAIQWVLTHFSVPLHHTPEKQKLRAARSRDLCFSMEESFHMKVCSGAKKQTSNSYSDLGILEEALDDVRG